MGVCWWHAGGRERQRGLSPTSKHTFKADLDFPLRTTDISFLKKHLEKWSEKLPGYLVKTKPKLSFPPSSCQCPFKVCDPQGSTGAGAQLSSLARRLGYLPSPQSCVLRVSGPTHGWWRGIKTNPFPRLLQEKLEGFLCWELCSPNSPSPRVLEYP